jgi:glycosyltransferase involved in cell wall biosynthesis
MKIVHLNTHSYGGAAVVARRLHEAALANGIDSRFITKFGTRSDSGPGHIPLKNARLLYALRQQTTRPSVYRIGKYLQNRFQHKNLVNRPSGFEVFTPLNSRGGFADCTATFDPDVIHLHWVAGFVDHDAFFRQNRDRRFVWTLHDMNPFTGGCHYDYGCGKFARACTSCPQLSGTIDPDYAQRVLESKSQALAHLPAERLVIVSPSQWLLDLSRQSPVTSRFRHLRIENPSFSPTPPLGRPEDIKQRLNLPAEKKIVLFIADNLRNPRKGIDLVFAAAADFKRKSEVHFVGLGQATTAPPGIEMSFPGTVRNENELAQYLRVADVLVSPSAAENSPLTVIEALTCGTPVVSFSVGGVPELVNETNGALVRERSAQALAAALHDVLFEGRYDRKTIAQAAARHQPAAVLGKYRGVYQELLSSS